MQPKPIDSRRLLDTDLQRRTVEMEGFAEHLRGVSEQKEHPAETDYDVVHDEQGRRNGEESAKESADKLKHGHSADDKKKSEPADKEPPDRPKSLPEGQKGSRLDIEA